MTNMINVTYTLSELSVVEVGIVDYSHSITVDCC